MGWSKLTRHRAHEADARASSLQAIGYRGELDDDGYPLDGHGTAVRAFQAGGQPRYPVRNAWYLHELAEEAVDAAECGGGAQYSGYQDVDRYYTGRPQGYRWGRSQ